MESTIKANQNHSIDLEDAYAAEQFEWLLQWNNHFCRETDGNITDLQMGTLTFNSLMDFQTQKAKLEQTEKKILFLVNRDQEQRMTIDQLNVFSLELQRTNDKLSSDYQTQKAKLEEAEKKILFLVNRDQEQGMTIDQLTNDLKFITSQKEQLTIERDGMALQLEEQKARYEGTVAKQEQQIRSMQVIISESQQEICQKEAMRRQLLVDLEGQAQVHLQQMEAQKESLEENNVDSITCSICWETWDSDGGHRVVSLACGHLFGDSCIRGYIMRSSNCPICRQAAYTQDIRRIFGRHVMPNQTQ
ncbi:E3 ubiquitin-protein ligase RNF8-like [Drosophila takahashii]|uniref:E3 ubiquitin-protein ligase RNF8-like n=1 Tax=Drosophila takahashii TaxID=29030 RepID=UPI001CF85641|nr:E3 ubiquitin-protein ligase RNF8-like [Drosophila takahashii]